MYDHQIHSNHLNGFTFVEILLIIMIIGVLTLFIAPVFINLSIQAGDTTVKSVADSLSAASMANYQLSRSGSAHAVLVDNCQDVAQTLPATQALSHDYTIDDQSITTAVAICTVRHTQTSASAHFIGHKTTN